MTLLALSLCVALATLSGDRDPAAYEDWYPEDISPPPGTRYPCVLTPLPRRLEGIPEGDRAFINHAYALILRATQAKLALLRELEEPGTGLDAALEDYSTRTAEVANQLAAENAPAPLEPFRADVQDAIALQRDFFVRAAAERRAGASMADVYRIPEGRRASQRLHAAWAKMGQRYRGWPDALRDSVFHHLCALDLF